MDRTVSLECGGGIASLAWDNQCRQAIRGYNMEIGKRYKITHARKGEFEALLLAVEPTKTGDPDANFLRVRIETGNSSPYAWMANCWERTVHGVKVRPQYTEKLLRPSLIISMEPIQEQ